MRKFSLSYDRPVQIYDTNLTSQKVPYRKQMTVNTEGIHRKKFIARVSPHKKIKKCRIENAFLKV